MVDSVNINVVPFFFFNTLEYHINAMIYTTIQKFGVCLIC